MPQPEGVQVSLWQWLADGSTGPLLSCHVFNLTAAEWKQEDGEVGVFIQSDIGYWIHFHSCQSYVFQQTHIARPQRILFYV